MKKKGWLVMVLAGVMAGAAWGAEAKEEKAPEKAPEKAQVISYLGMKKCKMCHKNQYESWAKTPHAASLKNLAAAKPEAVQKMADALGVKIEGKPELAPACLSCHVTGYGLEGGYTVEKGKEDMSDAVTCEECHGPGSLHMKAKKEDKAKTIAGQPGEAKCRTCHTKEMSPEFDFKKYSEKGVHEHISKKK